MRKISVIALLLLFCGVYAVAQEPAKGEVFAGYSFLHADCGSGCTESNVPGGFNADGTYYFTRLLGVTADFDYHKKSFPAGFFGGGSPSIDASMTGLHFGPRVKVRMGKIEPFGHFLFGFTHLSGSGGGLSQSDNAFSMKLGGGVDVAATKHIGIRLGEFNYYRTSFGVGSNVNLNGQDSQNNFTYSAGVILH